ncbi:glycoside hydrolase family 57 protein [Candidatus Woesearchaeota archaeon]|nr:glycoside hydrolase family 57 protein [Candidatus Woesearchaeota archaeon]
MVSVCFYFQVHQPWRLRRYTVFDIGNNQNYFDEQKNKEVLHKVAKKCYIPTNNLMLDLIREHKGKFRISYSLSGVVLDQFEKYAPEVLKSFQTLAKTGCVEFLAETYYHSLSYLYSKEEFKDQVKLHSKKVQKLFGQIPKVFRNTELIYNNELANFIQGMGFKAILAEGADHIMEGWKSPNYVHTPKTAGNMKLLLKNYKLSDDIAFRFGNKGWKEFPLTVEKYGQWISSVNGTGDVVNLFMDYETFGEHQWEDTGIFNFIRYLPGELLKHPDNNFKTVSEAVQYPSRGELDVHNFISWADIERDLSAWLGNSIQNAAARELYNIERMIKLSNDPLLVEAWRKMTTSDHLYYMCTKWFNDGDVHKYFNPYESPYEGFIAFMNVLNDMVLKLKLKGIKVDGKEAKLITEAPSKVFEKALKAEEPASKNTIQTEKKYDKTMTSMI